MQVIIHRGADKIGGTCLEVDYNETRVIFDVGEVLPSSDDPEGCVRHSLPAVPGLFDEGGPPVNAVFISHYHGDHAGLLRHVRQVMIDLGDGVRAVARPTIGLPLSTVWLHRLLLGAGFVLLVLVADSRFELRISGYGLALGVTGAAAFAGSLAAPACARRWAPTALLPAAFLPPAAALYAGGVAPNLAVLLTGIAVTAFSFQLLKVLVDALVGRSSPDVVRGRVFSVYDVLYNVAFVLAGLLMIPLWHPTEVRTLLWWLAAAFLLGWLVYSRVFHVWPFAARPPSSRPAHRWRGRTAGLA
jgi:hypothetical protein